MLLEFTVANLDPRWLEGQGCSPAVGMGYGHVVSVAYGSVVVQNPDRVNGLFLCRVRSADGGIERRRSGMPLM